MYLDDMKRAMERIAEYIHGYSFLDFKRDYKTVDAVIRNFEGIGEAANSLPQALKERHPEMPWREMYLLRNKVSHEYFGIDYEIIWDIAFQQLPENMRQLEVIMAREVKRND